MQLPQGDNDLAEALGLKGSDGKNRLRKSGGLQAQVIGAGGIIRLGKNKASLFFFLSLSVGRRDTAAARIVTFVLWRTLNERLSFAAAI